MSDRAGDGTRLVLVANARVVTAGGKGAGVRRGKALGSLRVIDPGEVLFEVGAEGSESESGGAAGGRIVAVGESGSLGAHPELESARAERVDAGGRVLMPAFVDAHTHALWAGDRLDEWDMKRAGASYLSILEAGGGIMSTVRAVRAASEEALAERLRERLGWMLREGTMGVEIKSGYGLDTDTELKMLRAIRAAAMGWEGAVVSTACLGHALDPEACAGDGGRESFVRATIEETLPAVSAEFAGIAIDAYCERGAWSVEECERLFDAALALGHPVRVHTDQFNSLGMTEIALRMGAVSVDHLEASTPQTLDAVAGSERTMAVLLPCSGFHTDQRYADGARLAERGAGIVLATNCNPGSSPCASVPMAVALGVRCNGLSAWQAITAVTANAAALLGMDDRGRIEAGARADLLLLRHRDERMLAYEFGGNPVEMAWCGGRLVG
ncbi:MAG: imidazolonepropionase [Phycisphaerales bacterium]